jgi:putative transposase
VGQQVRTVTWALEEAGIRPTGVLRDRDATFPPSVDAAFAAQGARVVPTPFRAPRANAFAERSGRTVREDGLDWLLILGARHLAQVLRTYTRHYNLARPHRSLGLGAPLARDQPVGVGHVGGAVVRHDDLGGLIHEYLSQAA